MTMAFFQTFNISTEESAVFQQKFRTDTLPILQLEQGIKSISFFSPCPANDPFIDDLNPPELVVQINVEALPDLNKAFQISSLQNQFSTITTGSTSYEVFQTLAFNVPDIDDPTIRTAPVSFMVRYFPPVADEKLFCEHYLANHPPILAKLPGIRNIFCYLPLNWEHPMKVSNSGSMLGNEVVFDSSESFDLAQASDVRKLLRDDFNSFPIKAGPNSHFAMYREDL